MSAFSTVGVDLAKNVIQVHGVDEGGKTLVRRQLGRSQFLAFFESRPRCLIGMEACSGAHHWGRQLQAMGHEVRLMPPPYVKPCQARQDGCGGCRSDLRGGEPTVDAVRPCEE